MSYNAGESFDCSDCGENQPNKIGSYKLVNKASKEEHFVCKKCIKNYNIRKPN